MPLLCIVSVHYLASWPTCRLNLKWVLCSFGEGITQYTFNLVIILCRVLYNRNIWSVLTLGFDPQINALSKTSTLDIYT